MCFHRFPPANPAKSWQNRYLVWMQFPGMSALKKVEPGCVQKCFQKAGFFSTSEVATDSTAEKNENELADLVANLDSNVSVEEYVKIDDDLSIEEEKPACFQFHSSGHN
ncbi:hypothetical protein AVEN_93760-1 [Araneus ventricosus]|uniref:Uncharacterized protein n=1 Tax=Araneus ventricosus TaxID=182803 RepID=A0A4Y2P1F5_ARAVE|nr:hypothetical protein AVEN_49039-1 [Araneus ventricosus]GBN44151.1 hypothetical protein AVEN_93760-1 [Araneus ventricosus]